ncbi:hypothetical protein [Caldanaerobacter subterraneus]|uniref:Uncharacterized protein n=1 Tax=Caldanaerobacter subterraneus TaxID=911092 RepID=A0A7Y2LBF1_9THEO|nr:hypothetical protein [Caldanaerobacter subterraneus]NNG67906.1 hypothetical protein [Caldanaerobacter subterraneus]
MKKFFIILLLSLVFLLVYAFYPRNGTFNNLILSHYSGISFNKVKYFKNFGLKESNERNYANYDYRTNGYSIHFEGEKDYKIYDLTIAISKDKLHVLEIFPAIVNRRLFLYVSHNTYEILNGEVNFEYIEELWKLGE